MSGCSSWRVANYHHAPGQVAEADNAYLAVVLTRVLDLESETGEDGGGILEIEATLIKRLLPLAWIVANAPLLL